jgi:hypothetical protein
VSGGVGLVAGSQGTQESPATTVPCSSGASSPAVRGTGARPCQWPPCGRLFVPRPTGGRPQKYCSSVCRERRKAASRAICNVCPHCGGALRDALFSLSRESPKAEASGGAS